MKPLISVVIPVYNGEKTLEACLNSVIDQDYENFEIIIIDNGSIDKTYEIIKSYINSKIEYFHESTRGRGIARNLGVKKSSGKMIAMIDSDCVAPKNWLTEISKPIIEKNEKVVIGSEEIIYEDKVSNKIQNANDSLVNKSMIGDYIKHIDTKNIIFKREVFFNYRFDPDIKNCEDFEFYLQIKKQYKVLCLPNIKVKHNHKIKLSDWFKTQIDRGFETTKIYKKHKGKKHLMFSSYDLLNWVKLPFWLFFVLLKTPKEFKFIFVTELGWRFGIFLYYFDNIGFYSYEK